MIRILYCDDIGAQRRGFETRVASLLAGEFDIASETVASHEGFRARLESGDVFDVVVTDMNFEKAEGGGPRDGLEILRDAKDAWPECEVMLLTAFLDDIEGGDLRKLFLELKVRPDHVFSKVESEDPWAELTGALRVICRLVQQRHELEHYRTTAARIAVEGIAGLDPVALASVVREHRHHGMIGVSFAMRKVFEQIGRYAPYDKNVLVSGETGSGKGMVARAIHRASRRAERPFNEHNSSTIHESIAESELFGFAPDSGVSNAPPEGRKGLLLATDGGTLFLDEIGDMPLAIQAKMLKVVDRADGTFFPVGADKPVRVDVRSILATHKNLDDEVEAGRFRQDFLFRIRGVEIRVPALRERREDIPLLISDQTLRFCQEYGRQPPRFDREALKLLVEYAWPGNVRQLQDVVDCVLIALPAEPDRQVSAHDVLAVLHPSQEVEVAAVGSGASSTPATSRDAGGAGAAAASAAREALTPAEEASQEFARILGGQESPTLSQVKRMHGEPVVLEVMRQTLRHLGRYPNDEQAAAWFGGMTANAWRQFAFSHGITLRKINQGVDLHDRGG